MLIIVDFYNSIQSKVVTKKEHFLDSEFELPLQTRNRSSTEYFSGG